MDLVHQIAIGAGLAWASFPGLREIALFSAERLRRAEEAIASIAGELEAHRLPLRDALIMQQGLVELLQAHVEARRLLCLASVELARVSGLPLERGTP